jgi:PKD repeat protein
MRLLLACASCLLMVAVCTSTAGAEGFGELTRFGEAGIEGEKEDAGRIVGTRAVRLGVDASDNSVYVLDEPEPSFQKFNNKEEPVGPEHRFLRLQKFTASSGTYSFSASSRFTELSPSLEVEPSGGEGENDIQGVAVDSTRQRVFVLAIDRRKGEKFLKHDLEASVASTLFAFSTNPVCKAGKCKLVPAQGTKTIKVEGKPEEAVLVGPTEFGAQSDEEGKALLDPRGITVDPETGEVMVLAHEDPKGEQIDEPQSQESPDHYVLQRITISSKTGEANLGARYVDQNNFIKLLPENSEKERPPRELPPDSPIVAQALPGGPERIFVNLLEGVIEIPYNFSGEPSFFSTSATLNGGILRGEVTASYGSQLSVALGGPIYVSSVLQNEAAKAEKSGVVELSAQDGSEIGWTGGQVPFEGSEDKCVIQPRFFSAFSIAAGAEGKVFVLSPAYLEAVQPQFPAVIELGPGGLGCPPATGAAAPVAEVNNQRVEEVPVGESVTFKTEHVSQADALKVEWDFGDGTTETVGVKGSNCVEKQEAPDPRCPHVQHAFTRAGNFTVTEKIYTDDLAGPSVITVTGHIVVAAAALPTALAIGPEGVATNQPAEFDGSPSSDPAGLNQIAEYHWTFGDGQTESRTSPITSHEYFRPGSYTVSLTVTDAHGANSQPYTLPLPVTVTEPTDEEHHAIPGAVAASAGQAAAGVAGVKLTQVGAQGPDVRLASASLTASAAGLLAVTLSCPLGEPTCAGTLTLRTVAAIGGRHAGKRRSRTLALTLAKGSFAIAGGGHKTITLRLSAKARSLLARMHLLRAQITILVHDGTGATHTTQTTVIVRAAAGRPPHRRR